MATSRKIDAAFFDQRWVDELVANGESHFVLLFIYLIVTCRNTVGIFDENVRLWNFKLTPPVPFKNGEVFSKFGKRIRRIDGHPDKGIIVGFCDFQRCFSQKCAQWKWVERDLASVGLTYEALKHFDEEVEQPELDLGQPPPISRKRTERGEPEQRNIIPPKIEWIREYCSTRNNGIDPQSFYDFYESKKRKSDGAWMVGRNPMSDWQAAIRTWEQRRKEEGAASAKEQRPSSPVRNVVGNVRKKF